MLKKEQIQNLEMAKMCLEQGNSLNNCPIAVLRKTAVICVRQETFSYLPCSEKWHSFSKPKLTLC